MIKTTENPVIGQKPEINPATNFLLSRAELLSYRLEGPHLETLYKLHNGRYAVHVRYDHPFRGDELTGVAYSIAKEKFLL